MFFIKKTFDFFIYSNLLVSLCVVSLCYVTDYTLGLDSAHLYPFVFVATLLSYNFQRLVRLYKSKQPSAHSFWKQKNIFLVAIITTLSAITTLYLSVDFIFDTFIYLLPAGLISFLYPLPVFKKSGSWNSLRELPFVKIFLIAYVWSAITVGLVVEEAGLLWDFDLLILFLQRFCFVLAITIPFDIRDLKYDSSKLNTLPICLGQEGAKKVALGLMVCFELIAIYQYFSYLISLKILLALLITSLLSGLLIMKSHSDKSDYYFSFGMESTSILMGMFLWLTSLYF